VNVMTFSSDQSRILGSRIVIVCNYSHSKLWATANNARATEAGKYVRFGSLYLDQQAAGTVSGRLADRMQAQSCEALAY